MDTVLFVRQSLAPVAPVAVLTPTVAAPPVICGELVLFSERGYTITKTRINFAGEAIIVSGITGVRCVKVTPSHLFPNALGVLGFIVLLSPGGLVFGILMLVLTCVWIFALRSKTGIEILSAGRSVTAFISRDQAFVGRAFDAIQKAIIARG